MKVKDFISKQIQTYTGLYKDITYEKSKLKVLDAVFSRFSYDIAKTKDGVLQGYPTIIKYKRYKGKYIEVPNAVYGKEKYIPLTNDYFDCKIFAATMGACSELTIRDNIVHFKVLPKDFDMFPTVITYISENTTAFLPSKLTEHSLCTKIYENNLFLQQDWLSELIWYCEQCIGIYNNSDYYNNTKAPYIEYNIKQKIALNPKLKDLDKAEQNRVFRLENGYAENANFPTIDEIIEQNIIALNSVRDHQLTVLTKCLTKFNQLYVNNFQ